VHYTLEVGVLCGSKLNKKRILNIRVNHGLVLVPCVHVLVTLIVKVILMVIECHVVFCVISLGT